MPAHDIEFRVISRMLKQMASLPDDAARERVAQYIWARRLLPWPTQAADEHYRAPAPDPDTPDMFAGREPTQPTPDKVRRAPH